MPNRFFKLPFSFDTKLLLQDLSICLADEWVSHFNRQDYSGKWTSISLRSATGKEKDIYAHPGVSEYTNTTLMNKCSYFLEIVNSFRCEKEAVRLLSLSSGSHIKEHRDLQASYQYGFFRVHIPIKTGEQVSFLVDGCRLNMKSGECWYANFDLPHSVLNEGTTDRVHLIMDCKRNEWSDEIFRRAGYDFEEEKKKNDHPIAIKKNMIAELSLMNTDTSRQLAEQIKREITPGQ